ncbi:hypothetical protein ACFO4E_07940 [Nocardiopsis mangrovi]|uniref:Uncharacterized protein n=1 Tax=Nocardiopsis mangrovi TaxID=1179818 RepID=A0ABV9DSW0_9ACTN
MPGTDWISGPFGLGGSARSTWSPQRTALIVVHHLTAANRLVGDVVPLLEGDPRVQLFWTTPPGGAFSHSGVEFLRGHDGVVLPWQQAVSHRFELAVAASLGGGLENVHAPVLVLGHGSGPGKLLFRREGDGPAAPRDVAGAHSGLIAYGRVVPSLLGVAHHRMRDVLARTVPPAAEVAEVVGEPAFDRLTAGADRRAAFRRALGVGDAQKLVVVSSTWQRNSLLGTRPDLPARLIGELPPAGFRVVVIPHPGTWVWHGRRQVRAWLGAQGGDPEPGVLPPEDGWQAALVAADLVIGDHGSVTYYAAALGRPVLMGAFPKGDVDPASHNALLGLTAPRLDRGVPLRPQVEEAIGAHVPERTEWYRSQLTSAPGASATLLRSAMYRLMGLAEPATPARTPPIALPRLLPSLSGEGAA